MAAKCWLWPNKIINKADSGKLRDEHNAAVNEHGIMKAALEDIAKAPADTTGDVRDQVVAIAKAALERLKP